jgi:hypothetical protein
MLVQGASLQAQAPVNIEVAVDPGGIREVRTTFASVDAINDVALASLTEGSVLTLNVDSPLSVAVLEGARRALQARGVERVSLVGSSGEPTHVRLTPGGELVVTIDGWGSDAVQPPPAFLRAVVPGNTVAVAVRSPVPVSVFLNARRALEELGATSVQLARP